MTSGDQAVMSRDWRPRPGIVGWSLAAASILVVVLAVVAGVRQALVTGQTRSLLSHQSLTPFITIGFALLGALVASKRPRNPVGWLLLATAALYALNVLATVIGLAGPGPSPAADLVAWLSIWLWLPGVFLPTLFLFLFFPNGRLPSRRWRPVAWASGLGLSAVILALALHPGPIDSWGTSPNPYGLQSLAPVLDLLIDLATPLLLLGLVGSAAALIVRFRRSQGVERSQMKWLVYAAGLMLLGFVVSGIIWYLWPDNPLVGELSIALTNLGILGIAAAAALAILRYHLYDIDLIVNRTLVYGGLTAAVAGLYALVVGALGIVFQTQGNLLVALLATGFVAVLFQPLRERLQRGVNRLVYGERDDPVKVLSRLGRQLEVAMAPDVILPALVETVAQTLKLPYVAISLCRNDDFELVAEYGKPVTETLLLPLIYQSETVGQLIVAPRSPDEPFSPADRALLETIAHQAGPAVHAVRLTADLQRSRQRLVTAREEERRRLRRDLHDELGPALAALHLQAAVLRRLIYRDQEAAETMIDEFRQDIRAAIGDIRRVVYELRPPALDQLGLVAALQAQASRCSLEAEAVPRNEEQPYEPSQEPPLSEDGLRVTVEASQTLPTLPAAVEVAAYRIVQEALANVVHHAQAHYCVIRLELNGMLEIEVVDDGAGLPPDYRPGVGLISMRERAEELGGKFAIEKLGQRGTRVAARLPLSQE